MKKFSLVIALAPSRNAEVLKSIKNINYDKKKYEIIVEKGTNPSANRNNGVKKAKGEIIGFIDDDAVVDKEILNKAEEFFKKYPAISIVGGPQLTPEDDKFFARSSGYALSSIFGAWKMSHRYEKNKVSLNADETMLTSANLFCKKNVFKKVLFDVNLFPGEDPKFIKEAIDNNFKIAYSPEIIINHRRRDSFFKLIKQIYSYGLTRPKKEGILESLKKPSFLIPSLFLLYLLLLPLLGIFNLLNWIIVAPLVIYLILDISFSLSESLFNKDILSFFIIIFIYPSIHLSYGAGFLVASIKKLI